MTSCCVKKVSTNEPGDRITFSMIFNKSFSSFQLIIVKSNSIHQKKSVTSTNFYSEKSWASDTNSNRFISVSKIAKTDGSILRIYWGDLCVDFFLSYLIWENIWKGVWLSLTHTNEKKNCFSTRSLDNIAYHEFSFIDFPLSKI